MTSVRQHSQVQASGSAQAARWVALLMLLGISAPASAASREDLLSPNVGEFLHTSCVALRAASQRPDPALGSLGAYCLGVVTGVSAALQVTGDVCLPDGVSTSELVARVIGYIEAQPERREQRAALVALQAIVKEWPCAKP